MADIKRAVLFLDDAEASRQHLDKPLMLQELLFCPVLAWMMQSLREKGVEQFLLFCPHNEKEAAENAVDSMEQVKISDSREDLLTFLRGKERVMIVPGAAIPVDHAEQNEVYAAPGEDLITSLIENSEEVANAETVPGFTSINSFQELYRAQYTARCQILSNLINHGVDVMDPNNTYIDPRVKVGDGTVILPGSILRGKTVIGEECEIGPNSMITNCTVGDHSVVNASQINDSTVGSRTNIGPFAYVRPGCCIGDDIKVGDFVEVKNSTLGNGTKISHLTYVGDSDVGEQVNFGCGTVTVNFDGKDKHRCTIGDHVFLGCNTNLVAPVKVGDGAYTAAGSTITDEVPAGDLGIARARQSNLAGWAKKRRKDGRLR